MAKTSPQPAVVLRENCIIAGTFYAAGAELPFLHEEDLPEALRGLVARGDEVFFTPGASRNIYGDPSAEIQPDPLPIETERELADIASKRTGLAKAQMASRAEAIDSAYESAAAELEARTTQYFVRRGGEMARVERARLKPGEVVFVRRWLQRAELLFRNRRSVAAGGGNPRLERIAQRMLAKRPDLGRAERFRKPLHVVLHEDLHRCAADRASAVDGGRNPARRRDVRAQERLLVPQSRSAFARRRHNEAQLSTPFAQEIPALLRRRKQNFDLLERMRCERRGGVCEFSGAS